jgi:hypothetical protein
MQDRHEDTRRNNPKKETPPPPNAGVQKHMPLLVLRL